MVARNPDADPRTDGTHTGPVRRFLMWWQRFLTALVSGPSSAGRATTRSAVDGPTSDAVGPLGLRSSAIVWAGGLGLLAGALCTVLLAPTDVTRPTAIAAAIMTLVWAAIRWALLWATATGALKRDPRAIRGAWALGSIAWAIGVTPELRALAWLLSGALTWYALERLGAPRRQAGVSVGIAWGSQAVVVIGSWLARNAIVAFLATRG